MVISYNLSYHMLCKKVLKVFVCEVGCGVVIVGGFGE